MSGVSRWQDSGHLERASETVGGSGGQEAFGADVTTMRDDTRGWRLVDMRKRCGMTQQAAAGMGASVARVSQIEGGAVTTQDVLSSLVASSAAPSSSSPTSTTSSSNWHRRRF
jgi:hypothetical protein